MHSCVHFGARLVQKWQKCLQFLMQSTIGIVMARSHYSSDGLVIFVVKEMVKKMVLFPSWEDLGKGQIRRKKKQFTFSKLIRNFLISWEPNGWQSPDKLVPWLPASTTFSQNAFHPSQATDLVFWTRCSYSSTAAWYSRRKGTADKNAADFVEVTV